MIVSNEIRPTPAYVLLKEVIHLRKQLDKLHDENEKLKATRRTCHITREPGSDRLWYCDSCKSYHDHQSDYAWEYCPRCGAKRVSA